MFVVFAGGDADRQVFILSDQCFPPYIASSNFGCCIQIVRVEFATLMELGRVFVDIFTGNNNNNNNNNKNSDNLQT
jgi:hypothetical protein